MFPDTDSSIINAQEETKRSVAVSMLHYVFGVDERKDGLAPSATSAVLTSSASSELSFGVASNWQALSHTQADKNKSEDVEMSVAEGRL